VATDKASILAALAILGTCVGALVWMIEYMFTKMLPMIEKNIDATTANTLATKNADKYLQDRNGRDAEAHKETLKAIAVIPTKMQEIADLQATTLVESVKEISEQHVKHQTVDKVTRNEK